MHNAVIKLYAHHSNAGYHHFWYTTVSRRRFADSGARSKTWSDSATAGRVWG